jgi:hypothetical protein
LRQQPHTSLDGGFSKDLLISLHQNKLSTLTVSHSPPGHHKRLTPTRANKYKLTKHINNIFRTFQILGGKSPASPTLFSQKKNASARGQERINGARKWAVPKPFEAPSVKPTFSSKSAARMRIEPGISSCFHLGRVGIAEVVVEVERRLVEGQRK